jgi:hypothetical protein
MTYLKALVKAKPLPGFILKNKNFLRIKKVSKVFPSLGLTNFAEKSNVANESAMQDATALFSSILGGLYNFSFYAKYDQLYYSNEIASTDVDKIKILGTNISLVYYALRYKNSQVIKVDPKTNKITLRLPEDIGPFKKDQSLFKVYTQLMQGTVDLKKSIPNLANSMPRLEDFPAFIAFSSNNIASGSYDVVFSSDGVDGLWDIATMSMRGIESCQSWDGAFKSRLIGSMCDPYVGIIYLTNNKSYNKYGPRMVRRCVVKFLINKETSNPVISLDRMYPEYSQDVANDFLTKIKSKVSSDVEVKYLYQQPINNYIMPYNKIYNSLTAGTRPYEDTKFTHGNLISKEALSNRRKVIAKKNKISKIFQSACSSVLQKKEDLLSASANKKYQSSSDVYNGLNYAIKDFYRTSMSLKTKNSFVSHKNIDACSPTEFVRDFVLSFKSDFNKSVVAKNRAVKAVNNYFASRNSLKTVGFAPLKYKDISKLIEAINEEAFTVLKKDLKVLLAKKSKPMKLP